MYSDHTSSEVSGVGANMDPSGERHIPLIDFTEMTFLRHVKCGGMARISLYEVNVSVSGLPRHVAKKSLFNGSLFARFETQLRSEMAILSQLKHENVVKTFGVVETGHDFGLVMEYLEFGSYKNFFETLWSNVKRTEKLEKQAVPLKIRILDEITNAMKYLHGFKPRRVLHLDLKSDNVLLDYSLHSKICDFGLSRMTTLMSLRNSTAVEGVPGERPSGTPGHIAPERLRNAREKPTTKADVYSFGILEWEILTDKVPYADIEHFNFNVLKNQIIHDHLRPLESHIPEIYEKDLPELVNMMKKCWSGNPSERPCFENLHTDLKTLEGRISEFDKQAKTSARKILDLYKTNYHSRPTNASVSEPPNRYMGVARGSSLWHSPELRQTSSMPPNTIQKEVYHPSVTSGRSEDTEIIIEKPPFERHFDREKDHLLPKRERQSTAERQQWWCSKKLLVVLTTIILLSISAAIGGIFISRQSSGQNCPDLELPIHGSMKCTGGKEDIHRNCVFSCGKDYVLIGPTQVTCSGGKWSDKPPTCESVCPNLKPVQYGKYNCTDGCNVNSTCTFSCDEKHQIKGFSSLTCGTNRQWSHPEPNCVCPKCFVGVQCQFPINWKTVLQVLSSMGPYQSVTVHYGEEIFTCSNDLHSILITWSGTCTDSKTGTSRKCRNYPSPRTAAESAAAVLIRDLAKQKIYTEPCDPNDMPTVCDIS